MFKRIIACFILIILISTSASCKSTKDVSSVSSEYEIVSIDESSSLDTTVSDTVSAKNSSPQNITESKVNSKNKVSSTTTFNSSVPTSKTSGTTSHSHSYAAATCTQAEQCTVCGDTKGTPTGHSYNNGVCIWCFKADSEYINIIHTKKLKSPKPSLMKFFRRNILNQKMLSL